MGGLDCGAAKSRRTLDASPDGRIQEIAGAWPAAGPDSGADPGVADLKAPSGNENPVAGDATRPALAPFGSSEIRYCRI